MANLTIANLPRVTPTALRELILSPASAQNIAVVDVRDADYIGGHIKNAHNAPTSTHDTSLPELVRKYADKDLVVFTCMLSQQRGPSSALKYARERERLLKGSEGEGKVVKDETEASADGKQKVAVLQGGFEGWIKAGYGPDEKVTEGYRRELWEEYED